MELRITLNPGDTLIVNAPEDRAPAVINKVISIDRSLFDNGNSWDDAPIVVNQHPKE